MALRCSCAIVLGDIFSHRLLHFVVKTGFVLVIADGLVRVNLPVPRHRRPLYGISVRDGDPLLLHFTFKRLGDLLRLIVAPSIGMSLQRRGHLVDPVIGRLPAVSVELGNGLCTNILRLAHDVFKNVEVRSLADARPVDLAQIGHIDEVRFLALGGLDDIAVGVALRFDLGLADFLHEFLHAADDAGLGAAGRHARVGEAMGVDFEPVELVEEEGLEFAGDL
ncbi:hypothetical protein IFM46972_11562, partial [Aspergillus udagawae]